MARPSPIDWTRFERTVGAWFSRETGLSTLWAYEHASQPAYPFASLKRISGPISYGRDDERYRFDPNAPPGEEIAIDVCGQRDITVSCQAYAASNKPGEDAFHYLAIAQASLGLPSVLEVLRASGIAVIDCSPPQDISFIAGGCWKSRAGMDVRFRLVSSLTERMGYIASVGVDPDIDVGADFHADADFGPDAGSSFENPDGAPAEADHSNPGA